MYTFIDNVCIVVDWGILDTTGLRRVILGVHPRQRDSNSFTVTCHMFVSRRDSKFILEAGVVDSG